MDGDTRIMVILLIIVVIIVLIRILKYRHFLSSYKNKRDWYNEYFHKYVENIEAFNQEIKFENIINKIKPVYEKRKNNLALDEIEIRDIINNLEVYNDNFVISIFIACMGFVVSVSMALYSNGHDFIYLLYVLLVIIPMILILLINIDINARKRSRKISFYKLCLEVILKFQGEDKN
ncbi:hypothetical protein [Clostridium tyrobutyricum]|uniref:hypothetical protein n=1 Tax=Clostridium tyrobutyricum TaxID=1519 RepID=UPI001C385EB1|nr:hypothetical protein [Clostridium tyrobutyricum]MBV4441137.1 hypothetical protein [Clostridium tyrobutyricum]